MNASEAILRLLAENGVEVCFGNPGTSEMHLVAAFDRVGAMRPVLGLFEGVCTGAADGYARMSDRPAATLLHLGPGLGNAFANLHNAWRARSRIINLVGDHATYHRRFDAPLQSDIPAIAKPVSDWIAAPDTVSEMLAATGEAIRVARRPDGGLVTLIVPADVAWSEAGHVAHPPVCVPAAAPPDPQAIAAAAEALRAGAGSLLLLGGRACLAPGLRLAARIAQRTGAKVMVETFPPRLARGQGVPHFDRVAYLAELAVAQLKDVTRAVAVGTKAPVAFFAYPGRPGQMLPAGASVLAPAAAGQDPVAVLAALADALEARTDPVLTAAALPDHQAGPLTGDRLGRVFARLLPEGAVVVDEGVTQGLMASIYAAAARPHDWLTLTGGAIGIGIPLAVGAALGAPGRPVVALQADGSALYTIQGLWTAARENLDVVTIILNNGAYAILKMELDRVGASAQSARAQSLLSLGDPAISFVDLARGFGVPATRVDTADGFAEALSRALAARGPHLIEAMLAP